MVNRPTGGRVDSSLDLLMSTIVPTTAVAGSVVADILVTPDIAPRMKTISAGWQRLQYHDLEFIVNATASSIVSGEFVAAFIPDPTDTPPNSGADKWVTAHTGSSSCSWWKSLSIRGALPPQRMYTSYDPSEPRFSSPGRFVIAVISPPSADASISVKLRWKVTFSQPSLEQSLEEDVPTVYTLQEDTRLLLSDGNASQAFDQSLYKNLTGTAALLEPDDFEPPLPEGVFLSLAAPKTLNSDTGATGAPENAVVTHIGTYDNGTKLCYYYSVDGVTFVPLVATKPFSIRPTSDAVIEDGTVFEADPRSTALAPAVGFRTVSRVRRSLTSAPVLHKLPSGKIVSLVSSKRF